MTNQIEAAAANRIIGGEEGHRGLFGAQVTGNKMRWIALAIVVPITLLLTPAFQLAALIPGLIATGIVLLVTIKTDRGSVFSRYVRKRRWRLRQKEGTAVFVPYSEAAWEEAHAELEEARGRRAKREALRRIQAIRPNPDGADRMGWLQFGVGEAGIAWHSPMGEEDRLTVAWEVPGQLRGLATAKTVGRNAAAFGRFVAGRVPSLSTQVQIVTHVLPTDAATYEGWLAREIDPESPRHLQESYAQAVELSAQGSTQRHFVVVTWPLDSAFTSTAERYGEEEDGWRILMRKEITATTRQLRHAGYRTDGPTTARQLAGVLRHMQNPSRPLDYVADTAPDGFGEASYDEFSTHVVRGVDPFTNEPVEWWHRTARIDPKHMEASWRTPLWHLPLFISEQLHSIRTVSFHIEPVPSAMSRSRTIDDLVADEAERISRRRKGHIDDGSTANVESAARSRAADLRAGSGHHGAYWVGYVTVTARNRTELATECQALETVCRNDLDISELSWLDSYQSAASGTTWPIGRGLTPLGRTSGERVVGMLAGRADKEALT